jgi:hypothetical protein
MVPEHPRMLPTNLTDKCHKLMQFLFHFIGLDMIGMKRQPRYIHDHPPSERGSAQLLYLRSKGKIYARSHRTRAV